MATLETIKEGINNQDIVKGERLETLLARVDVKKRFEEILGKKAAGFISSIISATKSNPSLKTADPMSIISSAVVAASLDLPINPNLGFAYIVPYKSKNDVLTKAQFQMGWKGFVQLAIRTGQFKTMNAAEIYEGELISWNRITGDISIDLAAKKSDSIIGYVAFFRMLNGFEKYYFMTVAQIEKHAKRYSKSYAKNFGHWVDDFNSMALKTVLKLLLSKYAMLSIEIQKALLADQAIVKDDGEEQ